MTTAITEPSPLYRDYMGTSLPLDEEPAFTFKMRLGRCYELAARAIVSGDLRDGTLVHGSIQGGGNPQRIGHAWVLLSAYETDYPQVWEPITGKVYDRDEWYHFASAQDERTYDAQAIRIEILTHQHWGRWHTSPHP